ncbi:MAG: hypothetical protein ACOYKZ_05955, partial [Chlamydiia bacterium]
RPGPSVSLAELSEEALVEGVTRLDNEVPEEGLLCPPDDAAAFAWEKATVVTSGENDGAVSTPGALDLAPRATLIAVF